MIKKTFILLGSILFLASFLLLNSCGIYRPVSAKDYPPDPKLRVKKNIEEGRGFRLMGGKKRGAPLILQAQMNFGELLWTL